MTYNPNDPNEIKARANHDVMVELGSNCRGRIIDGVIGMEAIMDSIVANYFCDDKNKAKELTLLTISREMGITAKLKIIRFLIKKFHEEELKMDWNNKFDSIIEFRNKLAHSKILGIREAFLNFDGKNVPYIVVTRSGKEEILVLNIEKVNLQINDINLCSLKLLELFKDYHQFNK